MQSNTSGSSLGNSFLPNCNSTYIDSQELSGNSQPNKQHQHLLSNSNENNNHQVYQNTVFNNMMQLQQQQNNSSSASNPAFNRCNTNSCKTQYDNNVQVS